MELGKFKTREVQPTVLRLHPDLRDELIRTADLNNRSLTKEISARLQESLKAPPAPGVAPALLPAPANGQHTYSTEPTTVVHHTNDKSPAHSLTEIDRAMLTVFHQLPPEKQLALLSLFR